MLQEVRMRTGTRQRGEALRLSSRLSSALYPEENTPFALLREGGGGGGLGNGEKVYRLQKANAITD